MIETVLRKKGGRDMTRSFDNSPYTKKIVKSGKIKTLPKRSITKRLRTDLGRSVGVGRNQTTTSLYPCTEKKEEI